MRALVLVLSTLLALPVAGSQAATAEETVGSGPAPLQSMLAPDAPASDNYPHVSFLERAILGQCYVNSPLAARLERMELKAFGQASESPDLSQRTDALEQFAENQLHEKFLPAGSAAELDDSTDSQSGESQSSYPRITALENAILGQSFTTDPLSDRLRRMEIKAFGSASGSPDLSQRTDLLEKYAEKVLHKRPLESQVRQSAAATGSTSGDRLPKRLLSLVSNSLLGMVGIGNMGPGGFMAPPGPGNMGFSGVRIRTRQSNVSTPQEPERPSGVRRDDPAVFAATPPPPEARVLTKVGWCEVQLWGHTFSDMHLSERLGQLNRLLRFEPGKSDLDLMDDVGGLIKAVITQKQSGTALGSTPQAVAR